MNKTTCVCCNDDMFYSNITYGQLNNKVPQIKSHSQGHEIQNFVDKIN